MANGHTEALAHALGEDGSGAGMGDGEILDEDHEETIGDKKWEWAKKIVAGFVKEAGLTAEEGVDRVVEATGAEDCMLMGIAIAKQGGNCKSTPYHHLCSFMVLIQPYHKISRSAWVTSRPTASPPSPLPTRKSMSWVSPDTRPPASPLPLISFLEAWSMSSSSLLRPSL